MTQNKRQYKGKPGLRIKTPCKKTHKNYCANHRKDHNSRASKMNTKAKNRIPEIARNPVPSDKSLLLLPTPYVDSHIGTVMRDGSVFLRMT